MRTFLKVRLVWCCALVVTLIGLANSRLAAQGAIGSILGTVTDASGAVIAGARVQAVNAGTSATQATTTDAEGRYRIPALAAGTYDVQAENTGFQTAVRKAVVLNAGADVVVDFSMSVGQVAQTVVVEAAIPQVETTTAALGNVVEPQQMRDLPLNGRNFEELVQLSPGVNVSRSSGATKASFTGKEDYWTVSGSRPNGQAILMDGTVVNTYQDRGTGSGILGTSLGVDAIAEFQLLTNTYGAQYGGNGAVMNSVTRSGTNAVHGSAYEFTRNGIFDAVQWPASKKSNFWKHQYGGTLGGPIRKDKMFFFANYEGIRQQEIQDQIKIVPDALARVGVVPLTITNGVVQPASPGCTTAAAPAGVNVALGPSTALQNCGEGSANAATFAKMKPYLDLYPLGPNNGGTIANASAISGYESAAYTDPTGVLSSAAASCAPNCATGTAKMTVSGKSPGQEYFAVGRYDWNMSEKDNLFARYLFDDAYTYDPFRGSFPAWPEYADSRNQFLTIGEKHVFSDRLVNSLNLGYTRTFFNIRGRSINPVTTPGVLPAGSLDWSGDLWTRVGEDGPTDGSLALGSGISAIGGPQIGPIRKLQTKKSIAEDLFWIDGAHSFRFGGAVTHSMTTGLHPFPGGGTWTFANLTNFVRNVPLQFNGPCNFYNNEPSCTFDGTVGGKPLPIPDSNRADRHWEFVLYVQDDWKLRPNLTVNLGLRYSPTTNPYEATRQNYILLPVPYGTQDPGLPPQLNSTPPSTLTPVKNFFLHNPSLHNFDPRIGFAWSPVQRTSLRAGYGIFHAVMQCRDYCYGSWFSFPWTVRTATSGLVFPTPFQANATSLASTTWGTNPYQTTPYMQQWNLSIQREVMRNTILTVAYVGSHGVHMVGQRDSNPPLASGMRQPYTGLGVIELSQGQSLWPNFPGYLNNLVAVTGTVVPGTNSNANLGAAGTPILTCSAGPCTLATASGQPIVNPASKQMSYAHIVQTSASATSLTVLSNQRWNPNFSHLVSGMTDINSHYHALQAGLVRRLTSGLSSQFSYTYSSCTDISSGNWSQEGGTRITDAYNLQADRGPCQFGLRHNFSANAVYLLPLRGNRLAEGWQVTGILYISSGGPITVSGIQNLGNDNTAGAPQANYVPNAPGCNAKPVNDPVVITASGGLQYLNPACFQQPPVGEEGDSGRDHFFGPRQFAVNTSIQKNTKLTERFSLQIRAEGFNIFNHRNLGTPTTGFTQSGTTGTPNGTFGEINSINGTMRQIQLGAKLTF